jgi:hypothetical protein
METNLMEWAPLMAADAIAGRIRRNDSKRISDRSFNENQFTYMR